MIATTSYRRYIIRVCLALSIVFFSVFFTRIYDSWHFFLKTPLISCGQGFDYQLKSGASLTSLAKDLKNRGHLNHPNYLIYLAHWQGQARKIKAGHYHFNAGMTATELLKQLVAGRVIEYRLTIIEGWTFKQMLKVIENEPHLQKTLTGLSEKNIMLRLGYPQLHPEGQFFPDTYIITDDTTDLALLKRAFKAMQIKVTQAWLKRAVDLSYKNAYQALIVASLIEKETALVSEKPLIASVILNRLAKDMRLQIDPTTVYGLLPEKTKVTAKDLRRKSVYNTYLHKGLPPTPIALPSLASLEAALHPATTKYLYFVAKGDSSHRFSKTLAQQSRAIEKYKAAKQKS